MEEKFKTVYGLTDNTKRIFEECHKILEKKNHDYSGRDNDSLKNFQKSADIVGITRDQGIMIRLMDKMARISNLLQHEAKVKDETIKDTIFDAINYLAILYYSLIKGETDQETYENF